jgi:uncharacterized protein YbjT (DUF2867 family)
MNERVIITGATGYVGEGVLLECLEDPSIAEVLVVGRRRCGRHHAKLKELLVPDFFSLAPHAEALRGYNGCFFCAGISSVGLKEADYTRFTHDATFAFATVLQQASPGATFIYVSGAGTDSSEKGNLMWARVKGRTENDLVRLGFARAFNFRPGIMRIRAGQTNPKGWQRLLVPVAALLLPGSTCTMEDVGRAMINAMRQGWPKPAVEARDIKALAKR